LSVARTELLAVDHAIRVTVYASAGTLDLTSHLSVTLPIRVLSMLSVDPPTSVSRPPNVLTVTQTNRPDVVNGLCLHLPPSGTENHADLPPSYRTRPSSLEHPQDITVSDSDIRRQQTSVIQIEINHPLSTTLSVLRVLVLMLVQEILRDYEPTRSSWSTTPSVGSQIHEYPDKTPHMIDGLPLQTFTTQHQRLPVQAIGTQFPSMDREERAFQDRARARSSIFKQGDKINSHESSPGNYIVSPVPSLCRARARALMITGTSESSRQGGSDGDRNQGVHGDRCLNGNDRRDFRSYESPFSRRVKEKLRGAHISRGPSDRAMKFLASAEDREQNREPEILSADLISFIT